MHGCVEFRKCQMTNEEISMKTNEFDDPWVSGAEALCVLREDSGDGPVYDLEERTARFGEAIIDFCAQNQPGPRTNRLIDQLTGCGTSVDGNYCEADDALSQKDFPKIIGTCRKEARETKYFLRMVSCACPNLKIDARLLWREANELHLIFSKIRRTAQKNLRSLAGRNSP
jgi:four helix bundle protein